MQLQFKKQNKKKKNKERVLFIPISEIAGSRFWRVVVVGEEGGLWDEEVVGAEGVGMRARILVGELLKRGRTVGLRRQNIFFGDGVMSVRDNKLQSISRHH